MWNPKASVMMGMITTCTTYAPRIGTYTHHVSIWEIAWALQQINSINSDSPSLGTAACGYYGNYARRIEKKAPQSGTAFALEDAL